MIRSLVSRVKYFLNPPKKGDVYYGDPFDFIIGKLLEQCLHGMRTVSGDASWNPVPSDGTVKLTITLDCMPYYVCKSEVLGENVNDHSKKWLERSQPRRICKKAFKQMILDERLEKGESIKLDG